MKILNIRQAEMQFYHAPAQTTVSNQTLTLEQLYALIRGDKYKAATLELRSITDEKQRKEYKRTHFDFVTPSCTGTKRSADAITKHSEIMAIDIDDYEGDIELLKAELIRDPQLFTLMAFISPSGKGLKLFVLINTAQNTHLNWFLAIEEYMQETYHVEIDKHCKDIARSCFLPYDEYVYINDLLTHSDNNELEVESILNSELWLRRAQAHNKSWPTTQQPTFAHAITPSGGANHEDEDLPALVKYITAHGINLTSSYDDWTHIGFALAYKYGEQGRQLFHDFSRQDQRYNPTECDKKYSSYLRGSSTATPCNLATIFFIAKQQGIDISHLSSPVKNHQEKASYPTPCPEMRTEETNALSGETALLGINCTTSQPAINEEEDNTFVAPTFSDKVVDHLPPLLQSIARLMQTPLMSDMLLFGSLPILCSLFHFVSGIYDRRRVFPLWFGYLYAHAGCSKGILTSLLKLSDPVEAEIQAGNQREMDEYKEAQQRYLAQQKDKTAMGADMPVEPPYRTMYLPANSSASATYRALHHNHGWGLIFETEGDVLANALSKDYGDYSTGLRNAFHHEPIRMSRCTNNEHITIPTPNFSCLLSGTPQQVRTLFPNAENGLLSRYLFYDVPLQLEWRNVFDNTVSSLDDDMEQIGQQVFQLYHLLQEADKPISFQLTTEQQAKFNQFFAQEQKEFYGLVGWDIVASVRRLALSAFRLMMVLSICRLAEGKEVPDTLVCTNEDFETGLTIMDVLMQHTSHVFATLIPPTQTAVTPTTPLTTDQQRFFQLLSDEFTTKQYKQAAAQCHIQSRTADKLMHRLVNKYGMVERVRQGVYHKIHAN